MNKFDRLLISLRILQLEIELAALKDSLKTSNLETFPSNSELIAKRKDGEVDNQSLTVSVLPDNSIHFLVKSCRWRKLRIRIDPNKNHKRAHLHIDIDGIPHSSSIAIDNGEKLAGDLDRKIKKMIKEWIEDNRDVLMEIWNKLQKGETPNDLLGRVSDINR